MQCFIAFAVVGFLVDGDGSAPTVGKSAVFTDTHRKGLNRYPLHLLSSDFDASLEIVKICCFGAFAGKQKDIGNPELFHGTQFAPYLSGFEASARGVSIRSKTAVGTSA